MHAQSDWDNRIPVTPAMDPQLDDAVRNKILNPDGKGLLEALHASIFGPKRRKNWFQIYLTTFILVRNQDRNLAHSRAFATKYAHSVCARLGAFDERSCQLTPFRNDDILTLVVLRSSFMLAISFFITFTQSAMGSHLWPSIGAHHHVGPKKIASTSPRQNTFEMFKVNWSSMVCNPTANSLNSISSFPVQDLYLYYWQKPLLRKVLATNDQ